MISDKPKCGYFGTPDSRHRYIKEMAFCILIAFRSLMTSATLISTVSNLMAGLSKIKEDEHLGPDLEFGCARFQKVVSNQFLSACCNIERRFYSSGEKNSGHEATIQHWIRFSALWLIMYRPRGHSFDPRNTEFRLLRCYLKQNEIPQPLSQKVTQFLQHQYSCLVAR